MSEVIDLSVHNGHVNFSAIKGVDEVIIRASIGYGTVDANLLTNATGAAKANLAVSYYHFAYPHTNTDNDAIVADAEKQATYFMDTVADLPAPKNLCIDLEEYDDKHTPASDSQLSPAQYALWLRTFLDAVEQRTGKTMMIYSYRDYLDRHLPANHTFGIYPLWLASYSNVTEPTLPVGWNEWAYWQYSEHGKLPVSGEDVDLSRRNADLV